MGCPATTSVFSASSSLYHCDITLHFPLRISGTPALHLCIAALASPFILNVFVALSLSLSISISNSLYLFLSLPPSLSPLMNHLPLPLNSTESEGSSKVALISPASHSRETWKQQTALQAVHERMHLRVSTLMSVCFYQAQGNTKGRKSLWAQYVICMSYANGCVIT